jgi:hypothetical protein
MRKPTQTEIEFHIANVEHGLRAREPQIETEGEITDQGVAGDAPEVVCSICQIAIERGDHFQGQHTEDGLWIAHLACIERLRMTRSPNEAWLIRPKQYTTAFDYDHLFDIRDAYVEDESE